MRDKPTYRLRQFGFRHEEFLHVKMGKFGMGIALNMGDPEGHRVYLGAGSFPAIYAGQSGGQNQQAVLLVRRKAE